MKRYFRFIVVALILSVLICGNMLPASAALGNAIITDDLENAGPGWTAVRATDIQKGINNVYQNSIFGYPYPGGDKTLKLADKANPDTASYVISGNKSIYFTNDPVKSGTENLSAMMTLPKDGSALEFKADKVYIARFRMRVIEKGAKLSITVRTWDAMDDWITFQFNTDVKKGYAVKATGNLRLYDKAAIQKIGENDYEVALRFAGVNTQGADSYCYLMWDIAGTGGFSFDDMKVYESKNAPDKAFELEAEGGNSRNNNSTSSGNTGNSGNTENNSKPSTDNTASGNNIDDDTTKNSSDSITENQGSDSTGIQGDTNTDIKNDVQTVTIKKEAVTFTTASIIFIIVSAFVLLGSVTYIVLSYIMKRR